MQTSREIKNTYADFVPHRESNIVNIKDGQIHHQFLEKIQAAAHNLLAKLEASILLDRDFRDVSIYTGSSGIALLYTLIGISQKNSKYLNEATSLLDKAFKRLKLRDVTYLCGGTGPLSLGAVIYHNSGRTARAQELVDRVVSLVPEVSNLNSDLPDEILYGRAGYLYNLLYLNKHIGPNTVSPDHIKQVVAALLQSGQQLARREKRSVPLMYMWHGKYYIGGAHGISGILYMLLLAKNYLSQTELDTLLRPTIDYLQGIRYPSKNFPSSLNSDSDRLVHWCHGAPGAVYLFTEAYKVFGDDQYMQTALDCGEVVWKRGLLAKGYSICHGVSGNAYTFLHLYQVTGDLKHLHRSCQFADWCFTYGKHQTQIPDRPLSLFEGIAGVIYFLFDIQEPNKAQFPGYSL